MSESIETAEPVTAAETAREVLNVSEAAKLLRVSKTMLYSLVKSEPGFPAKKVGKKKLRFSRRGLLAWLERTV